MKDVKFISETEKKDIFETMGRKKELEQKEILSEVKSFFQSFSQKYQKPYNEETKESKEKLFLEDIKDMDFNTAPEPIVTYEIDNSTITEEELEQLLEQDAGYVNETVLDYENILNKKENTYSKTGLHTNALRWGRYAKEGSIEYTILSAGQILSRWGDEKGTFMSDVNVEYEKLELPMVKEKSIQSFYEILKPIPVEVSKVAVQPWNKARNKEADTSENKKDVLQYKMPVSIDILIENGYLIKKLLDK